MVRKCAFESSFSLFLQLGEYIYFFRAGKQQLVIYQKKNVRASRRMYYLA